MTASACKRAFPPTLSAVRRASSPTTSPWVVYAQLSKQHTNTSKRNDTSTQNHKTHTHKKASLWPATLVGKRSLPLKLLANLNLKTRLLNCRAHLQQTVSADHFCWVTCGAVRHVDHRSSCSEAALTSKPHGEPGSSDVDPGEINPGLVTGGSPPFTQGHPTINKQEGINQGSTRRRSHTRPHTNGTIFINNPNWSNFGAARSQPGKPISAKAHAAQAATQTKRHPSRFAAVRQTP